MERFFNIIHYILYKGFSRLFMFLFKPIFKIYKIPVVKRYTEKKGINPEEEVKKAFLDKEYGFSTIYSGGMIGGLLFLFLVGIAHLICIPLRLDLYSINKIILLVIFLIPSYYISHILVFKNDKYIKYFKEFDKKSKFWKRVWTLITLGLIIGIPLFGGMTVALLYKFV